MPRHSRGRSNAGGLSAAALQALLAVSSLCLGCHALRVRETRIVGAGSPSPTTDVTRRIIDAAQDESSVIHELKFNNDTTPMLYQKRLGKHCENSKGLLRRPGKPKLPTRQPDRELSRSRPAAATSRYNCRICSNQFLFDPPPGSDACDIVVATAVFGGTDTLTPLHFEETIPQGVRVCFFAFTTAAPKTAATRRLGNWWLLPVSNFPFSHPRLNARLSKMLLYQLFPRASYYVWADGKVQLLQHPVMMVYRYLIQPNALLAGKIHPNNPGWVQEANYVVKRRLAPARPIRALATKFREEGFPETVPGSDTEVLVYENSPRVRTYFCGWFDTLLSSNQPRDQMLFAYVAWREGLEMDHEINLFSACEATKSHRTVKHLVHHSPLRIEATPCAERA